MEENVHSTQILPLPAVNRDVNFKLFP